MNKIIHGASCDARVVGFSLVRNSYKQIITLVVLSAFVLGFPLSAFADVSGPRHAGTGTSATSGPGVSWLSAASITAADGVLTTASLSSGPSRNSRSLQGSNYGFSIPTGSTINGIQVFITKKSSSNSGGDSINDSDLNLIKNGVIVGSERASNSDWPTTLATTTYGSTSDLWGSTWTPADINASNFGVALSARNESNSTRVASVDSMMITVTYTLPDTTPPPAPSITAGVAEGGTVTTSSTSFSFSDSEAGVTYECTLDAGAFAACSSPKTLTGLVNGAHTFSVKAKDAAGNYSIPVARNFTVAIDATAPIISLVTPPQAFSNDTTPTLVFSSNEAGTVTVSGGCSITPAAAVVGDNTITLNALTNGTYSLCSLKVTDASGNQSNLLLLPEFVVNLNLFNEGMVSLSFDDGWQSVFDNALPLLNAAGLKSTQYIYSDAMNGVHGPIYMNVSEILSMRLAGHDIGAHSRTHQYSFAGTLPTSTLQSEIDGSRLDLLSVMGFAPVDSLAYPFGDGYNDPVVAARLQAAGFSGARSTQDGFNDKSTNRFSLKIFELTRETTLADLKAAVDVATTTKSWLIIMFHQVEAGPTCPNSNEYDYCTTAATLGGLIEYLSTTGVSVKTVSEGLSLMPSVPVKDAVAPVITQPVNVTASATSLSGAIVAYTAPTVTDANTGLLAYCVQPSGSQFPLGTTTVTCTVADAAGNQAIPKTFSVVIKDTTKPVVTLLGSSTINLSVGASFVDPGATALDEISGNLTAQIVATGTVNTALPGTYTRTYAVTDAAGNVSLPVVRTIIVSDTVAPVITLVGATPLSLPLGTVYVDAGATASDNVDGNITAQIVVVNPVNTAVVGTSTITYNVTDAAGNAATQVTRVVGVFDDVAPLIAAHIDVVAEATSPVGASVTFVLPTVTDNYDSGLLATCAPVSGSVFAIGTTTVTCTATDAAGNSATPTTFSVVVVDTTAPVIASRGDETIEATSAAGATVNYTLPVVTDNYDTGLVATCTPAPASVFALGTVSVGCSATDSHGNVALATSFDVTVVDTTAPIITLVGSSTVEVSVHGTYTELGASVADNYDTGLVASSTGSIDVHTVGSYVISYDVTDSNSNAAITVTRTVLVQDLGKPVITLTGENPVIVEVFGTYTELGATAEDNYDTSLTVVSSGSVNVSVVGSYVISYDVTDSNGNAALTVTRTVQVVDTQIPVITLVGENPQTIEAGTVYTELGATVADNYDAGIIASIDATLVNISAVGSYTVTYTAVDSSGNNATSVPRTVNVIDTVAPTVTVVSPPSPTTNTVSISFSVIDETATVHECKVDADGYVVCTSPFSTTFALDGEHVVTVRATDGGGNMTEVSTTPFVTDATAPVVTITTAPAAYINVASTTIEFSANEDAATLLCTFDGSAPLPCLAATAISFTSLAEGSHTFVVTGTDLVGNTATASVSFIVDTIKPVVALGLVATPTSDNTPTINFTAIDVSPLTATCTLDGEGFACAAPSYTPAELADGAHTIVLQVTDAAGNVSDIQSSEFVVDTLAPSIVITSKPASWITTDSATFEFSADDSTATIECNFDGAGFTSCESPKVYSSLFEGHHTFVVRAGDAVGHSSVDVAEFTYDVSAPVIAVHSDVVAEATSPAGASVTYELPLVSDNLDTEVTVSCVPLSDSTFALGVTTVTCTSTDVAGNSATPTTFNVTVVDTTAPVIASHDVEIVEATSAAGATVIYTLPVVTDNYDTGLVATCIPAPASIFALGTTSVACSVTDTHANVATGTAFDVVVVDTTAPVITLVGNSVIQRAFGVGYSDEGATALDLVDGDVSSLVVASGDSISSTTPVGTYEIAYDSTDAAGNVATTSTRTVIVSDLALSLEQQSNVTTDSITITWTTSHPATSRVLYDTVSHTLASSTEAGPANYGYANSTVEDAALVTNHSVTVSGLSAATTYYFRPVSHGSPETLGQESSVTTATPPPAPVVSRGGGGGGITIVPTFVKINNGATTTTSVNVTLSLQGPYSASQVWISNDASFSTTTGGYVPLKSPMSWVLPTGAGTKVVYVRFGIASTTLASAQASIVLLGAGQVNAPQIVPATPGQVLGASTYIFTRTLRFGMSGEDVTELQNRLTLEGLYQGPITGFFGQLTQAAVMKYQEKNGIGAVGIVGPKTRALLNQGTVVVPATGAPQSSLMQQLQALLAQVALLQAQLSLLQGK